jgi:DNA gyrase subunit B
LRRAAVADDESRYVCGSIRALTSIEGMRRRPGMYVGDTDTVGLHRLVDWLLRDIVEWQPTPTRVRVTIEGDVLTIEDDRRVRPDPALLRAYAEESMPLVEYASALHCCNAIAIGNALSREFVFELWADGVGLRSNYARGQLLDGPRPFTPASAHGCRVQLVADETIFSTTTWDVGWLTERLRVLAGLSGVRGDLHNREFGHTHEYIYPRGPASWIEQLAPSCIPRPALLATATAGELRCDVGWAWVKASGSRVLGYVSTRHTPGGGVHTEGFRDAIGQLGRARGLHPFALVSVYLQEPRFPSQERQALQNEEVRPFVRDTVAAALERALEDPELRTLLR